MASEIMGVTDRDPSFKNLHQKLIEVRAEVPYLQKDAQNKQQGFRYVSSSSVLEAIRPLFDKHGILIIPTVTNTKIQVIPETSNDRTKYVIFTELFIDYVIANADDPKDIIKVSWYGQGVDYNGEKGVGKALTYAEKYFLLKLLNIPTDEDDPDSHAAKKDESSQPPKNLKPANQNAMRLKELLDRLIAGAGKEEAKAFNEAVKTDISLKYNVEIVSWGDASDKILSDAVDRFVARLEGK